MANMLFPVFLSFLMFIVVVYSELGVELSEDKSKLFVLKGEKRFGTITVTGEEGRKLDSADCRNENDLICRNFGSHKLTVQRDEHCIVIRSTAKGEDGDDVGEGVSIISHYNITGHLFGGPEQVYQYWPLDNVNFTKYSYVTKEQDHQGFAERYWLTSEGIFYYIEEEASLFIQQDGEGSLEFIVENIPPYPSPRPLLLVEHICSYENAKVAHMKAVEMFLNKPSDIPDERMIRHPIWSTWARYKENISEAVVLEFANEINYYGFNNSQLEIDDFWETCYGSLTFDTNKFLDMKNLSDTLKEKGFRVTLWVHPFINSDCDEFEEALNNNYLVKNTDGNVNTKWWQGENSSIIDVTNPEAVDWWKDRLQNLIEDEGIDGFKFDAGETSWLPQIPILTGNITLQPNLYTQKYLDVVAEFGSMGEARVGFKSQHHPFFVRMLDKDSRWNFENGLPTLITTLLQMNMVGYPFVLPDMVGGNGYQGEIPSKEMFIRWLQANVFMPSLQFSYVPWDYDNETIDICQKFTKLRTAYADKIIEIMNITIQTGAPVNPPIWWIDPENEEAQTVNDEYLLGEDILVAPIVVEGAVKRDIYLPSGTWKNMLDEIIITGPIWLKDYPVALNELAYFQKVSAGSSVVLGNVFLILSLVAIFLKLNNHVL